MPLRTATSATCLLVLLAGCAAGDDDGGDANPSPAAPTVPAPAVTGHALAADFAGLQAPPPGWTVAKGSWSAAAGEGAHTGLVQGAGLAEPGLSSLLATPAGDFGDFEMETTFRMDSGEHPQGAGAVFHWVDDANYQIIRYSISENGWHLFTVDGGNRNKQGEATVPDAASAPQFGDWVELRIESKGGHVLAFAGAAKVIDYQLPSSSAQVGQVGLFVRGDTKAVFDRFAVEPL